MLALLCVWLGLGSLAYAIAIVLYRPLFSDQGITATLYAAIFSLTFAGLTLWDLRKQPSADPAVNARRMQAWVGSIFSVIAIACIYTLIARAEVVPRTSTPPSSPPTTNATTPSGAQQP